jgi:signal transduction histidine kinase
MELAPLDINRTVEGLLKMLKRLIGEDIQVETAFVPELWSVLADAGSMEQVIMNIVVNARDAMKAGGTIRIATGNEFIDEG